MIVLFLKKDFIYFLEVVEGREKERERNIDCLLHAPNWRSGQQPRHVLWSGFEQVTFLFAG